MIDKLPFTEIHTGGKDMVELVEFRPVAPYEMQHKINELADAVNNIQKEREAERFEIQEWIGILEAVRKSVNVHEKQIDELQMKAEPEKCKPAENGKCAKNAQDETPRCPFCQQELHKDSDGYYTCYTDNCGCMKYGGNGASGSESLWSALIRTRKALEIAVDALTYANKCIKGGCVNWETEIDKALEKITAILENKNGNC